MKKLFTLFAVVLFSLGAMANWYITGVEALVGESWGAAPVNGKMTNKSVTFENVPAGTYEFKLTNGTDYSGDGCVASTTGNVTTGQANGNMTVTCTETTNITFKVTDEANWKISVHGGTGYYILGNWENPSDANSWVSVVDTYKFENNKVTISLAANTTYNFKFYNNGYDAWNGNNGTMDYFNHTDWRFNADANCKLVTKDAGTYTFNLTWDNAIPIISVDYPNCIWNGTSFLGDGAEGGRLNNKYKVQNVENLNAVNIQKRGEIAGIYVSVPAGINSCSLGNNSTIEGAGVWLHLNAFTSQETEVTIDYATGSVTFLVYYADGTPIVPDEEAPSISVATADPITYRTATINITATDNIGVTKYEVYNGEELIATSNQNPIVATGLDAEAQYTLTIFAYDKAGNRSQGFDVTFTTAAAPQGQELVNGEHAVLLSGVHYANTHVYELTITSEEKMDGLGGSFWYISGVGQDLRNYLTKVDDNTIKFTVVSSQEPQLYTPLYVMMPGEVNFDQPTIVWAEKTAEPADQATISVSSVGYTTYFNSLKGYEMPQNMEGYIFNKESLSIEKKYEAGQYVPAGEALVLKATDGDYKFFFAKGGQKSDNNALLGTDAQTAIEADANAYFYALSLDENDQNVGFYWMNETGAAFTNGAHKAYLKLDKSLFETPSQPNAAPRRFVFDQAGIATDVDAIEADNDVVKFFENGQLLIKKNGVIYNAMGQIVK